MTIPDVDGLRVVLRRGGLRDVPAEADRLGARRVLLVAGGSAAVHADTVADLLGDLLAGRVTEVAQHVPVEVADQAVAQAGRVRADLVVTIGGGSATGLGKAVAKETGLRVIAVPTTFSGSEATPVWGLTADGRKTTGRDPRVRPVTVVYDPDLFRTLPPGLALTSALNALAHCLHHKLAHVLGGTYRLPHADTHAVLLPHVVAANAPAAPRAMARASAALGWTDAGVARAIWDLARDKRAPTSLAALGWPAEAADDVVDAVLAAPPANPRPVERHWLRALLLAAHRGDPPGPASHGGDPPGPAVIATRPDAG